jgi:hypothetical protein
MTSIKRRPPVPVPKVIRKSTARLKVCYTDGSWTHDLYGDEFALDVQGERVTLNIRLSGKPDAKAANGRHAVREFLAKRHLMDSIQIGKKAICRMVEETLRKAENPDVSVALSAGREGVTYPASVTFGPDAITLNLG